MAWPLRGGGWPLRKKLFLSSRVGKALVAASLTIRSELVYPLCYIKYNCATSQGEYLYNKQSLSDIHLIGERSRFFIESALFKRSERDDIPILILQERFQAAALISVNRANWLTR